MKNELEQQLLVKYKELLTEYWDRSPCPSPMIFGFDCDAGWYNIIDNALSKIQVHLKTKEWPDFSIRQVKEKFGRLEIYLSHTDEVLSQITNDATLESIKTCEVCGTIENIGITKRWYKTICKKCFDISQVKDAGNIWLKGNLVYKNYDKG